MTFGQSFLPVIGHLFGRAGRVFELCAGNGCSSFPGPGRDRR
jgi:hypothetical protein